MQSINLRQQLKLIKILPNFLTILNALCGCFAILCIFNELSFLNFGYQSALILVLLGAVLDFLDGYLAKLLDAKSKLGVQLDSMSDLITFSLAPSLLIYDFLQNISADFKFTPFFAFLILIFSMIRLARFNTLPTKSYFLGLPTPANGIFFMGIPFISFYIDPIIIIITIIVSSLLLVSNVKFESFKKDYTKADKGYFYILFFLLILSALICLFIYQIDIFNFISLAVLIYVFSSLLFNFYKSF